MRAGSAGVGNVAGNLLLQAAPTATWTPANGDVNPGAPAPTPTWTPVDSAPIASTATWTAAAPTPTETPLAPPTATWTPLVPTDSPAAPLLPTLTATETPLPTHTPITAPVIRQAAPPRLLITEFLADPNAVTDANGEFIEIVNADTVAVNLNGWSIRDLGGDNHTITVDLTIQPGEYIVLARNGDPNTNGGLTVNYVYGGTNLANGDDELILVAPDGTEADQVLWGGASGLTITRGASLERTTLTDPATWLPAQTAWPGSAGDLGSPGQAYDAPPAPPTPTTAPPTSTLPLLLFTEFLADPQAVGDNAGEWIEIYNADNAPINLNGWTITDLGSDSHTITVDLIIQPGAYLLLARNGDPNTNGGVQANYVYSGISLANGDDELLLLAPNGQTVDQVFWGGTSGVATTAGASLARTIPSLVAPWVASQTLWPGSAGDFGSPGQPYQPPLEPTATLTPTLPITSTSTPIPTATPTLDSSTANIVITEFLADPQAVGDNEGEWIELFNASSAPINLNGWSISDLGSDSHTITVDLIIQPGQYLVLARNGDPNTNGGVQADYVYSGISLANGDDEIILTALDGRQVDQVIWGGSSGLASQAGSSLERTSPDAAAPWATAQTIWPGSAGDMGTPGEAPQSSTPSTPTATATPGGPLPRILITEFLADPQAVGDNEGEWIEIYNASSAPINLNGWSISDLGSDSHTITVDLIIQPGQYLVLARNGDPNTNGGVQADYVYSGISLANGDDEIILTALDGRQVDQVIWGGSSGLVSKAGSSLERTSPDAAAPWATAQTIWPGSAGDMGTPGEAPQSSTPSTPTATPTPGGPAPRILITEFLADPQAVGDNEGEWIEIYNASSSPVNLNGWSISDLGSDSHTITVDLIIQPGQYLVLARNGDRTLNGGVVVDYVYTGISLSNSADEIILSMPDDSEIDRVQWGDGSELSPRAGVSLERTNLDTPAVWAEAVTAWPGSTGDMGSPGAAYNNIPSATATPALTPTPQAAVWSLASVAGPLILEEIAFDGSDEEFVAILNRGAAPVMLAGWSIGDAQTPGSSEGIYALPDGAALAPGGIFVVARNGAAFRTQWGRRADAQFEAADAETPTLERRRDLASGGWALNDSGDEVVLLDPSNQLADAVAFTGGDYGALQLRGELRPPSSFSLQRVPDPVTSTSPLTALDQRHRFLFASPQPFVVQSLPTVQNLPPPALPDNLLAVWGSLGAASNFSADFTAPPHYLAAAAGASGLHFIAIADPVGAEFLTAPAGIIHLPAWAWTGPDDERAVVYHHEAATPTSRADLLNFLASSAAVAQWQGGEPPSTNNDVVAFAADNTFAPGNVSSLYDDWSIARFPLLPAGNANPPLPGRIAPAPRYTGLAAPTVNAEGLQQALTARRGWLTSRPGLWLTLRATLPDGRQLWMGETTQPVNGVTLFVDYSDLSGETAGLAIWQDDGPVRQLDLPPADGRWTVDLPAPPGSFLYAVATQFDGDFAITAPIYIEPGSGGRLLINEVLPAPGEDLNGDGVVNGDDEFIEIYNPGDQPVSLVGWRLQDDSPGGFTLGPGRFVPGGGYLRLWRRDTRLALNDDGDSVRLLDAEGNEVDLIRWSSPPTRGRSLSRIPDGGDWWIDTQTTPDGANRSDGGRPYQDRSKGNQSTPGSGTGGRSQTPAEQAQAATEGQAGGPPGSLTGAKRMGLEQWVEFQAVVTVPSGLFNSSIYVADPAPVPDGPMAGLGIHVFMRRAEFPPLQEGDRVLLRGMLTSFRGEMELILDSPEQVWRISSGLPLEPLPVAPSEVGESVEGRLVILRGVLDGFGRDSIFLRDPDAPDVEAVRVTVRSSLAWRRPFVNKGEVWQATGVVSQLASAEPWNDGYRVLVRYESDLVKIANAQGE